MVSSTPRIAPLEPPYPDDVQQTFARIMGPGRAPLMLFRVIAASPRAWERFRAGSLLDRGPLPLREREIVIDRTTARSGCEYEWGVHVASSFTQKAGLTAAQIADTLADTVDPALWNAREQALLAAVDALTDTATLSDDAFAALRAHFDDAAILEIMMLVGFYRMVSVIANGLALPPEPDAARFADVRSPARP